MLTGYNTDIDHDGNTYHVQTEDKGRTNPFVESLVYASGEILYSRRTPYEKILDQDTELKIVASMMERQHRTIVEAIRRGRLAQLIGKPEPSPDDDTSVSRKAKQEAAAPVETLREEEPSLDQVILDYLEAQKSKAHLVLRSSGDKELYYGAAARMKVTAVDSQENQPQEGVRISAVFKSTAEPRRLVLAEGVTDEEGSFLIAAEIPEFNGGTSAVVIGAESDLGQTEIKHLVHR